MSVAKRKQEFLNEWKNAAFSKQNRIFLRRATARKIPSISDWKWTENLLPDIINS